MKIKRIESIKLQFHPDHIPRDGLSQIRSRDVFLVKIYADNGVYGVGEAFSLGTIETLEAIVEEVLSPLLINEDPTSIEKLWEKMYKNTFRIGRRGIILAAISAIDIALWDLLGKLANMPVYKLLGGYSNYINAYASGGYYLDGKTIQDLEAEALVYKQMGFKAMKMKIGGMSMEEDLERIRVVKNVLKDDVKLAIDANNSYSLNEALILCKKLEETDLLFFEEPVLTDYVDNSSFLAQNTAIPIAGYETEYTRFGFKRLIDAKAVNIVQTDVIWTGGISECKKIASLASAAGLEVIPHFSAGAVSLAANLHFSLSLGNCHWFEYTMDQNPIRDELNLTPHQLADGTLVVNGKPGIGVELNEQVINKYRV